MKIEFNYTGATDTSASVSASVASGDASPTPTPAGLPSLEAALLEASGHTLRSINSIADADVFTREILLDGYVSFGACLVISQAFKDNAVGFSYMVTDGGLEISRGTITSVISMTDTTRHGAQYTSMLVKIPNR